jgi:hypothetical protein
LSLSSCNDDEYTCDDGLCVSLTKRCDRKPDCQDASDEVRCHTVNVDATYNKFLSPPMATLNSGELAKVQVNLSVEIFSLSSFDPIGSNFETQFLVELLWIDGRLTFDNLRTDEESNKLSPVEMSKIWTPSFVFYNTKEKLKSIKDDQAKILVHNEGEGIRSDRSSSENKMVYSGNDNPLKYSRFYNIVFKCNFDMQWYPFDSQLCAMVIITKDGMEKFLELNPVSLKYLGPKELQEYLVKNAEIKLIKGKVEVQFQLGRQILSIVLTSFIPTIILNLIGHTSNYFKEFFFEAVISLNVTVMLVLTTMFISISNNLPRTAYVKMIDYWLLFNLFKPFVDIIMQTYMEHLRDEDEERTVNQHGKPKEVGATTNKDEHITKVFPMGTGSIGKQGLK